MEALVVLTLPNVVRFDVLVAANEETAVWEPFTAVKLPVDARMVLDIRSIAMAATTPDLEESLFRVSRTAGGGEVGIKG